MIFWLMLIGAALTLLWFLANRPFSYWSKRGVNGPKGVPLFGNIWQQLWKGQLVNELEWLDKYGQVYGTYFGFKPALTISDPDLIKQVLVKDFNCFVNRRMSRTDHEIYNKNMFFLIDDNWKRVRSIASPSFTSSKLRDMNPLMDRCVDKLMDFFERAISCENGVFNAKEVIAGFSIDVIASTSFEMETNANDDRTGKQNPFVSHGMQMFNFSLLHILGMVILPPKWRKHFNYSAIFRSEHFNFFQDLAKQVVLKRKETNHKRNDLVQLLVDAYVTENDLKHSNYDNLSVSAECDSTAEHAQEKLVNNNKIVKTLDDNEIIAQCILFFVAGFETTASTLTHCLYELALNAEIQERLFDQLERSTLHDNKSDLYYETVITKLPYLDAVVKETLRKYPSLPRFDRQVGVERYNLAGIELLKGQVVNISAYAVHHNAQLYPEPEVFNPDRFMPENKHLLKPYTFLAFGQGPRNCLGMRFAYQEIKLCLAKVVQRFQFVTTEKTPEKLEFSKFGLMSVADFPLKVVKR